MNSKRLAQIVGLGLPIGRWHGTGSDAGLEATGCRNAAGGALLDSGGGGRRHRGSSNLFGGSGGGGGGDFLVVVLVDKAHSSNIWELTAVVAERRPRPTAFGHGVGRVVAERGLGTGPTGSTFGPAIDGDTGVDALAKRAAAGVAGSAARATLAGASK